jgi:drug/metabolite transporter (DMT)-like permease
MVLATILASGSALYDKHLLQRSGLSPALVQAWFSIYLVPALLPLLLWWFLSMRQHDAKRREDQPIRSDEPLALRHEPDRFEWRWTLPLITATLLISDFLYFTALQQDNALISVISPLRRTSVIVAFAGGIVIFREGNLRAKAASLVILLIGVFLISLGA